MSSIQVKDYLVPLADYAVVDEEATLYEAVLALEEAQQRFDQSRARHRAVLVLDKNKNVVGKLDLLNALEALEPRYAGLEESEKIRSNFTPSFLKSLSERYGLWADPLGTICKKAFQIKVKDIIYLPSEGELISEEATLNEAIHQLVMGRHQSLLVTRGREVVGILRLSDVFEKMTALMKACAL